MTESYPVPKFLLIWLCSSMFIIAQTALVAGLVRPFNWLDTLVLFGWVVFGSRWFGPTRLEDKPVAYWLIAACVALLYLLMLPRFSQHLQDQSLWLALVRGLWIVAVICIWSVAWQRLLGIQVIAYYWQSLRELVEDVLSGLQRTYVGQRLKPIAIWSLAVIIALHITYVALAVHSIDFEWEPIITTGIAIDSPSFDNNIPFTSTDAPLSFRSLVIGPGGQSLFAGTEGAGIFRSNNGGESWQSVNRGLPDLNVQSVVVGPDDRSLFVVVGATGQFVLNPVRVGVPFLDTNHSREIGIGLFRSIDDGQTWQRADRGLPKGIWALAARSNSQTLFAEALEGLFRSDNMGDTWRFVSRELEPRSIYTLVVGPDNRSLFAGTDNGMYRSDNDGERWRQVEFSLSPSTAIPINPTSAPVIPINPTTAPTKDPLSIGPKDPVQVLIVDRDGKYLYAATGARVFRSRDNGSSWTSQGQLNQPVFSLVILSRNQQMIAVTIDGKTFIFNESDQNWQDPKSSTTAPGNVVAIASKPGSSGFIAGTDAGLFRFDGQEQLWDEINRGLVKQSIPNLWVEADNPVLFASTKTNKSYSDDKGINWKYVRLNDNITPKSIDIDDKGLLASVRDINDDKESLQDISSFATSDRRAKLLFGDIHVVAGKSLIRLARSGIGWLPWANYTYRTPQVIILHENSCTVYAFSEASTLLRAEIPLPPLWKLPTPYLAIVSLTWQAIFWAREKAVFLLSGVALITLATSLYTYAAIMRPSRLSPATAFWLLSHPQLLAVASDYPDYADLWASSDVLDRLIVLQAPVAEPFTTDQIETELHRIGVACDIDAVRSALVSLVQSGFLEYQANTYSLAEPLLAQIQRRQLPHEVLTRLTEQTRQEHPLYAEARRFLARAGFAVAPADAFGLLCASDLSLWADVSPLYARLVLDRALDLQEFQSLCVAARAAYNAELRDRTVAVVIDRPPRAGDLYQIFALRAQEGLTIVPLPRSLIAQARLDGREIEALKEQIDLYAGRTDLYDVRAAVTDVLSFFGRGGLLADLQRRLTVGGSVVVFGVRKMGKSSLLGRLREECGWPVAVVDLEGYLGGLGYVYEEALRGWRAALQATYPDLALPAWAGDQAPPDPVAQAQAFRQAVGELLDLLADRPARPGLLLFLDEIDVLFGQPAYADFAAVLRGVAENPRWRGRFALLVAGLDPALNHADRMERSRNPFFAFFGELPLAPLDRQDARTMVVSIGGQMGVGYMDEALDLLVEAGGGHPFLTRQLCSQVVRGLERPATVSAAQAAQAVEEYLRLARNYMAESLWGVESGGPPAAEAALLELLATQPQAEEALIPAHLPPEERRARQLALDHLRDQSLVCRAAEGWKMTIPLYRSWIRRNILR